MNETILAIIRIFIHYGSHFLIPGIIAKKKYPKEWKRAWIVLIITNLVDLDHLLANPIFDSNRLSIGNHLLHSYPLIGIYFIMLFFPKTRLVAIGLVLHMVTDAIDHLWVL